MLDGPFQIENREGILLLLNLYGIVALQAQVRGTANSQRESHLQQSPSSMSLLDDNAATGLPLNHHIALQSTMSQHLKYSQPHAELLLL